MVGNYWSVNAPQPNDLNLRHIDLLANIGIIRPTALDSLDRQSRCFMTLDLQGRSKLQPLQVFRPTDPHITTHFANPA